MKSILAIVLVGATMACNDPASTEPASRSAASSAPLTATEPSPPAKLPIVAGDHSLEIRWEKVEHRCVEGAAEFSPDEAERMALMDAIRILDAFTQTLALEDPKEAWLQVWCAGQAHWSGRPGPEIFIGVHWNNGWDPGAHPILIFSRSDDRIRIVGQLAPPDSHYSLQRARIVSAPDGGSGMMFTEYVGDHGGGALDGDSVRHDRVKGFLRLELPECDDGFEGLECEAEKELPPCDFRVERIDGGTRVTVRGFKVRDDCTIEVLPPEVYCSRFGPDSWMKCPVDRAHDADEASGRGSHDAKVPDDL